MKAIAFAVTLAAGVLFTYGISFAQNYKTVAMVKIEEKKNDFYVTLLRLKPGKVAAVAKLPKKSQAKIEGMSLKGPSGKKYKAKMMRMRSREVKKYLQSACLKRGLLSPAFAQLDRFLMREAEANCGQCDSGSGSAPSSEPGPSVGIGTGLLIDAGTADKDPWVNVGTFDIGGESGEGVWRIEIKYFDEGLNADAESDFTMEDFANPAPSPTFSQPPASGEWTEANALGGGAPVNSADFDKFWHETPDAPDPKADFNAGELLGE